jgi:hypothetical protein
MYQQQWTKRVAAGGFVAHETTPDQNTSNFKKTRAQGFALLWF